MHGDWLDENANSAFQLTFQIFDRNSGYADPEARHTFAMMTDFILRSCLYRNLDQGTRDLLILRMVEAAQTSLKYSYLNCGCYYDLPWIKTLLDLGSHTIRWAFGPQSLREFFAILDQFAFIDTVATVREPRHTDLQDGYAMPVIIGTRDLRYTDLQDGYGRLMRVITGDRVGEHYMKLRSFVSEQTRWQRSWEPRVISSKSE